MNNLQVLEAIQSVKKPVENSIVGMLWKNPQLYNVYTNLSTYDFTSKEPKFFFKIGLELFAEGKTVLDEMSVAIHLETKDKGLKTVYDDIGGYGYIEEMQEYVTEANIDSYIKKLQKYNLVIKLMTQNPLGQLFEEKGKDIEKYSVEEISKYYEAKVNEMFMNVNSEVKTYDMLDGLDDIVREADEGLNIGMPILSPTLNDMIGGAIRGQVLQIGGTSGAGKTTFTTCALVASCVQHQERIVVMINEEDEKKWKRDMLTWVVNNIYGGGFNKKRWRDGNFSQAEHDLLKEGINWMKSKMHSGQIILIPLPEYTCDIALNVIRRYASAGIDKFILDTFKAGYDADNDAVWLSMMQDMRRLYDLVKPSQKNVFLWTTFQLNKASVKQRYLTQDNIGMAKNIIDVASVSLLTRRVYDDELQGGINELKVFKIPEGTSTEVPVILDPRKMYVVIFVEKNRNGESQTVQVVAEVDLGMNLYKEVGLTYVPRDF